MNNKPSLKRKADLISGSDLSPPVSTGRKFVKLNSFVYDHNKAAGTVAFQVKYGPTAQLDKTRMGSVNAHYGADVGPRLSQYADKHSDYVEAARLVKRPLTMQEQEASKTGANAGAASINHLIASGTGQNLFNRMTLEFNEGREQMATSGAKYQAELQHPSSSFGQLEARKGILKGLAQQAAAVGRMTGIGRDILAEEHPSLGYGKSLTDPSGQLRSVKRNRMMGDVLTSFQGDKSARLGAYKRYLKNTFDSFGNLRVGNNGGNGRVSTGFDMPLDHLGQPTDWGLRLLSSLHNFGMPDMLESTVHTNMNYKSGKSTSIRGGVYTTSVSGKILSSSKQVG